jgi:hypothetical protein
MLAWATPSLALEEDPLRKVTTWEQGMIDLLLEYSADTHHGHDLSGDLRSVSVSQQRLFHVRNGRVRATSTVSTAARGIGSMRERRCTPQGLHHIREKPGAGTPAWGIIQERTFTGALADMAAAST